jgi:aspartate-semialdehyde dehydrogenase
MKKIAVGILGATGVVGQDYLQLLSDHPWFTVTFLAASDASSGKSLREATLNRWNQSEKTLQQFAEMPISQLDAIESAKRACSFVFSALSSEAAQLYEESYAAAGLPVISNASYHRMAKDVPLLIAEVNPEQTAIIPVQQKNRNWTRGFIVAKPNCSLQSYMIPLFPLHAHFTLKHLIVTTMQALSGAGYPGLSSLDILDNVIPYIPQEEEKSEVEPLKIFGTIEGHEISLANGITISAHCNRVPVRDGHLACVSASFEKKPTREEAIDLIRRFRGVPQQLNLPSAPKIPIVYQEENNRPQPRLDRNRGGGMAVTMGRLRPCPVLDLRFVALSHNTLRGAAGGGILNAELLLRQGYLEES